MKKGDVEVRKEHQKSLLSDLEMFSNFPTADKAKLMMENVWKETVSSATVFDNRASMSASIC